MPKKPGQDATWEKARKKMGALLDTVEDPELTLKIVSAIVKMKAVDLKMSEQDFGAEFSDD